MMMAHAGEVGTRRGRRHGLGTGIVLLIAVMAGAAWGSSLLQLRSGVPHPPVLRHSADASSPAELVLDSTPPREAVSLLFFEGRPTVPGRGSGRAVVTETGTVLVIDSLLQVHPKALLLDGAFALAAAPAGDRDWWVSTLDGELLRTRSTGTSIVRARAPFAASALWPDPRSEGVFVSRSPERFGFIPEEPGTPVVVWVTGSGGARGGRGKQVIPDHALLTTLANSGYLAAAGDTVYFAPLSRPELVALGPGGDTLWTSSADDLPPAPEPRFRLVDGRANIDYQPLNLALTLGPDGHLYVLRAADTAVSRARLDVIDRATGRVLQSAHLDHSRATLAANRLGRVYLLDGDRLMGAIPPARRESLPGFDLPRLGGGRGTLLETAGRVTLVNVWASWCTPCRTEMPALDSLQRGLPAEGFTFLALNEDTDREAAERFIRERSFDFPVLFGDGKLKARFHYPGLPYTVLLDRQGRIVRRWFGELAPADYPMIRMLVRSELLAPGSDSASGAVAIHHHHDEP